LAELRSGFDRLPDAARRREHDEWLSGDVADGFRGRILDVDQHVADVCGGLLARVDLDRRAAVTMDIWVAAIATHYELTVVTRNIRDLEHLDLRIFNP
jgi:predicted nucleic acid-binding protein